ncbi:MAG: DNA cytosine methyltransferase [Bacteroidales bacterium]|nr:DNA cytosine methyltransferase [Bacteroidales bacterium]
MFSLEEHVDDLFLIGCVRNDKHHIQWIRKNQMYNVRSTMDMFVLRDGAISDLICPDYLLLYDAIISNSYCLFECANVLEKSQKEMSQLKYPNPNGSYLIYQLGCEFHIDDLNLKELIVLRNKDFSADFAPFFVKGGELMEYKKHIEVKNIEYNFSINVGTLFSGIGAFEEALKQLKIPHKIKFACDNGEIELIPLTEEKDRKEYKDLNKRVRRLSEEEKRSYAKYKNTIQSEIEKIREHSFLIPTKEERNAYVEWVYSNYEKKTRNYVKESYLANYDIDPSDFHTDIRFMRGDDYKDQVDILVGGSPCQSFSTYGKKQGLEDARGTLFYDYARIIKESNPKIFIYENVAAIKSNDHGHTWETMLSVWKSLGYKIYPEILNAVDYDHPQLRRRVFIVGIREDICTTPYKFPEKKTRTKKSTDFLEKGKIPLKYYLGEGGFTWITTYEKHKRRSRVNQEVIGCQTANQQDNWIGDFRVEHPLPEHYEDPRIFIGKFDFKDGKGLVDAVGRKLTPRECLRLMGFSDKFRIVVDDHQAYHQSGNSIVVPVLKEIIQTIVPYLK